jgi:hypothetical protein
MGRTLRKEVEASINLKKAEQFLDMDSHPTGRSKKERRYRQWALRNCLFLNPLNDLGPHAIAAQDILSLPSFTTSTDEFPQLFGFFNQLKQEFVSGRWLLYDGLHSEDVHFSDRRVSLVNTLDYPTYSLAIEKVKAAYRIGYSILDKIAYFLNEYAALGVKPRDVYFKTIWYEKGNAQQRVVREQFALSKNLPLRGLYWLAKDLFDPELQGVMEPDAQELYTIRNRLEHSYLKVHDMLISRSGTDALSRMFTDRLAHSVARDDFQAKTLQVYKLARSALIYLSLGMHREEQRRAAGKLGELVAPMLLHPWRDSDKR